MAQAHHAQAADGWMPAMIPLSGLKSSIADFRGIASAAGREPHAVVVKGANAGTEAVAPLPNEIGCVGDVNGGVEPLKAREEGAPTSIWWKSTPPILAPSNAPSRP